MVSEQIQHIQSHPVVKHAVDIATAVGGLSAVLGIINQVLGILVLIAALGWWGIKYYNWYKGKKDA